MIIRNLYIRKVDRETLLSAAAEGMRRIVPNPAEVEPRVLVDAAIQGMLSSLNPLYILMLRIGEHYVTKQAEIWN